MAKTKDEFTKGPGTETNTDVGANTSGLYRHNESGTEAVVVNDPLFASAADAYVRLGFVRVGDVPEDYYKSVAEQASKPVTQSVGTDIAGLTARLTLLENENAAMKAGVAIGPNPDDAPPATPVGTPKFPDAGKQSIEAHEADEHGESYDATLDEEVETEKALTDMDRDELNSLADEEGVEAYDKIKSDKELVEAIEKNRSSKKGK